MPLVVDDSTESITKTSKAVALLKKVCPLLLKRPTQATLALTCAPTESRTPHSQDPTFRAAMPIYQMGYML